MITYRFNDVPLCIGQDRSGKKLIIATIAGEAEIECSAEIWEIDAVTLSSPLLGYPDVPIRWADDGNKVGRQMWDWVTASILASCTDDICEAVDDARAETAYLEDLMAASHDRWQMP